MGVAPRPYDPGRCRSTLVTVSLRRRRRRGRCSTRSSRPRRGDALAPVTVVVPTNYVGVAARRLLGERHARARDRRRRRHRRRHLPHHLPARRAARGAASSPAAHRRPVSTPVLAAARARGPRRRPGRVPPRSPSTRRPRPRWSTRTASSRAVDDARARRARCAPGGAPPTSCASRRRVRGIARVRVVRRARPHGRRGRRRSPPAIPLLADLGAVVVHLPQELSTPAAALAARARRPSARHRRRRAHRPAPRADASVRAGARLVSASTGARRVAVERPCGDPASCRRPTPTTRCARWCGWSSTRCARASRSSAWRCSTARPSRTRAWCTSSSTPPASPHNGAAVRTLADSVLGRGLLGLLALPDRDFQRHDVMRLLASTPVFHRGRARARARLGEDQPRGRDRPRSRAVAAAPRPLRARSQEFELAAERAVTDRDPHPEHFEARARATPARSRTSSPPLVRDLAVDPGRELARPRRLGRAPRARPPRARVPARRRGPRSSGGRRRRSRPRWRGSPGSTRSRRRPGVDVFRRTLELELDADLGRVGRLRRRPADGSRRAGARPRPRPGLRVRPGRGPLPDPRARRLAPPRRRTTRHRRRAPPARRPGRRRPPPPARGAGRRVGRARAPVPPGRPPPHHRARAVALPGRVRRARCPRRLRTARPTTSPTLQRRLVHPGAVVRRRPGPASSSRPPSRSTGCARCSTTRARGRRGRRARARDDRRRVAHAASTPSTARASRAFTRFDGNLAGFDAGPRHRRRRRRVAHPAADLRGQPVRLLPRVRAAGRHRRAARGALRGHAARPRQPRARDPRRVPRRGARPPRWRDRRPTCRGPTPTATGCARSPTPAARSTRPRAAPGGGCSGTATVAASSPSSTGSSPRTPTCAPSSACARSPPSCASASPTARPPVDLRALRRPRAALPRRRRPGRPHRRRRAVGHRLQDRAARPASTADDPTAAGTMLQLPVYAHAARASFGAPTRRWARPTGT